MFVAIISVRTLTASCWCYQVCSTVYWNYVLRWFRTFNLIHRSDLWSVEKFERHYMFIEETEATLDRWSTKETTNAGVSMSPAISDSLSQIFVVDFVYGLAEEYNRIYLFLVCLEHWKILMRRWIFIKSWWFCCTVSRDAHGKRVRQIYSMSLSARYKTSWNHSQCQDPTKNVALQILFVCMSSWYFSATNNT